MKYPEIEMGMMRIEETGEVKEEWFSADGKRKIEMMVVGGGLGWEGIWIKNISLHSTDNLVGGELMRVQYVKLPESEDVTIAIFVDVFSFEDGVGHMENFSFSSDAGGTRESLNKRVTIQTKEITALEYIEALKNESVRLLDEMPTRIDVEETARLFIEQLEERNFVMPILIGV